jgi:hypothetical protein
MGIKEELVWIFVALLGIFIIYPFIISWIFELEMIHPSWLW